MSIPLVQKAEKDDINTSIIAIKRNIERINMLLGLVDNDSPDLSGFATKQELQDAVTELQPVDEVASGNMHSVTSNAVANYSAPKVRNKNQIALFTVPSNWGIEVNEQQYPSTSIETWQPMINVNYTQDNKHNSAGFYKNMFCVGNAEYQTSVFLCDMTTLGDTKPLILKHKTVTGTTNGNGVLWSGNSNLDGTENIICAYPPSGTDYKVAIGKGTGCWVQLLNYDGTRMGNVQINIDIYYF